MSLTRKKIADLDPSATVKAARRTRAASSAAVAKATTAARSAGAAAQNAANLAQNAAQNATTAARSAGAAAQNATNLAQNAAQNATTAARSAGAAAQNATNLAQNAAQNATVIASNAAQNASEAAQKAAIGVNKGAKGVKQGVYTARSWAAPRLDSAADYCTSTVAPKVSSALRTTARQVSPAKPTNSKRSSLLTWSLLGAAVAAALGAAAVLARYRYRAAIAADSETADEAEEEVLGDSTGSQPAPVSGDVNHSAPTDNDAETSVNGHVSSSGW